MRELYYFLFSVQAISPADECIRRASFEIDFCLFLSLLLIQSTYGQEFKACSWNPEGFTHICKVKKQ